VELEEIVGVSRELSVGQGLAAGRRVLSAEESGLEQVEKVVRSNGHISVLSSSIVICGHVLLWMGREGRLWMWIRVRDYDVDLNGIGC